MRNTACFGVTLWFSKIHEAEEEMGYPLFNQAREKHHREGRKDDISKVSKSLLTEFKKCIHNERLLVC